MDTVKIAELTAKILKGTRELSKDIFELGMGCVASGYIDIRVNGDDVKFRFEVRPEYSGIRVNFGSSGSVVIKYDFNGNDYLSADGTGDFAKFAEYDALVVVDKLYLLPVLRDFLSSNDFIKSVQVQVKAQSLLDSHLADKFANREFN